MVRRAKEVVCGRIDRELREELAAQGLNISSEIEECIYYSLLTTEYFLRKRKKCLDEVQRIDKLLSQINSDADVEMASWSEEHTRRVNRLFSVCPKSTCLNLYREEINPKISFAVFCNIYDKVRSNLPKDKLE